VVQVNGNEIVLNIGQSVGLKTGTKLKLLEERKVKVGNKLSTTRIEAGAAEVSRVEADLGYAKLTESKSPVRPGMKVEEVVGQ